MQYLQPFHHYSQRLRRSFQLIQKHGHQFILICQEMNEPISTGEPFYGGIQHLLKGLVLGFGQHMPALKTFRIIHFLSVDNSELAEGPERTIAFRYHGP